MLIQCITGQCISRIFLCMLKQTGSELTAQAVSKHATYLYISLGVFCPTEQGFRVWVTHGCAVRYDIVHSHKSNLQLTVILRMAQFSPEMLLDPTS